MHIYFVAHAASCRTKELYFQHSFTHNLDSTACFAWYIFHLLSTQPYDTAVNNPVNKQRERGTNPKGSDPGSKLLLPELKHPKPVIWACSQGCYEQDNYCSGISDWCMQAHTHIYIHTCACTYTCTCAHTRHHHHLGK